MTVRVYLPATLRSLAPVRDGDGLPGGPAYAVTDAVRAALPADEEEEREYAVTAAAADAALALLAADPSVPRRRVVVAADVDAVTVPTDPDAHPAAVVVGPVPRARIAAVLVDDTAAADRVALAVTDPEVDLDDALQWYGVQELAALLGD